MLPDVGVAGGQLVSPGLIAGRSCSRIFALAIVLAQD